MRKLILSTLLGLWALSSQATVAIFSAKFTETKSGAGAITKNVNSGFLVMEMETGEYSIIWVEAKRGRFGVFAPGVSDDGEYVLDSVDIGPGKKAMVLTIETGIGGAITMKGQSFVVDLFAVDYWWIPKTMKMSGSIIYHDETDEAYVLDYSGSFTFNKKETTDGNVFGPTLAQSVERLRQRYLNAGYTEE